MPTFAFRAVDGSGKRVQGVTDAASSSAALQVLEQRGLVVIQVDERAGDVRASPRPSSRGNRRQGVLDATRALAALLPAGMPLARALAAAAATTNPLVAGRLHQVRARIERGDHLSAALTEHADLFPPVYVGLVRAGERSGDLAGAFTRLATQLEKEDELRSRLLSALIYPALLGVVGSVAVIVLLVFVLPRFAELLTGAGASLPRSTAFLLDASTAVRSYWYVFAGTAAALVAAGAAARQSEAGRRAISQMVLALPMIGAIRRQALSARVARLLGVLLSGGSPLLSALDGTCASLSDPIAREQLLAVRASVRDGGRLHTVLAASGFWTPMLPQLVAVGEESGRLQEFVTKAADILEQRTERGITRLVSLAEPALIVMLGAVVGFVALSLLQAIYGVNAGAFR